VSHAPLAEPPGLAPGDGRGDAGSRRSVSELHRKHAALHDLLTELPSLIVAYSGGVDSAYLAFAATEALGRRALCITADSPSYPDRHRQLALRLAREFGFQHELIHTAELDRAEYRANPANRCYFCKHELYSRLTDLARERRIAAIADGSNADDRGDYRPGRQAAREFGVRSPLDEVGLTKAEIRDLSRHAGLPTWNEPASACLSSRIPYFSEVTDAKLRMIERAEAALRDLGFRICRVRHHDETSARIEVGQDELPRTADPAMARAIDRELKAIGYQQVTIDPRGYRLGSLNDALRLRPVD
jgi:pyridinium-3,5-biscarboxylic acid mononucleotide sulfurtransferase